MMAFSIAWQELFTGFATWFDVLIVNGSEVLKPDWLVANIHLKWSGYRFNQCCLQTYYNEFFEKEACSSCCGSKLWVRTSRSKNENKWKQKYMEMLPTYLMLVEQARCKSCCLTFAQMTVATSSLTYSISTIFFLCLQNLHKMVVMRIHYCSGTHGRLVLNTEKLSGT